MRDGQVWKQLEPITRIVDATMPLDIERAQLEAGAYVGVM